MSSPNANRQRMLVLYTIKGCGLRYQHVVSTSLTGKACQFALCAGRSWRFCKDKYCVEASFFIRLFKHHAGYLHSAGESVRRTFALRHTPINVPSHEPQWLLFLCFRTSARNPQSEGASQTHTWIKAHVALEASYSGGTPSSVDQALTSSIVSRRRILHVTGQ